MEKRKEVYPIKSWSMFFEDIASGERTSDIRSTKDRDFKVGDMMILQEFDPVNFLYTGRSLAVIITYIQQNKSNPCAISRDALAEGYAVLSIRKNGDVHVDSAKRIAYKEATLGIKKVEDTFIKPTGPIVDTSPVFSGDSTGGIRPDLMPIASATFTAVKPLDYFNIPFSEIVKGLVNNPITIRSEKPKA